MTSRERIAAACAHAEPDCLPVDFGGGFQTGIHVSIVYRLRQALSLDPPGTPVKVVEVYQMLGEVAPDLAAALGVDTVSLYGTGTMFGFPQTGFKPWQLADGTPVLVPVDFNTVYEANGELRQWPENDRSASPSALMPAGGHFFDAIIRQAPLDEARLDPVDNTEEFTRAGGRRAAPLRRAGRATVDDDRSRALLQFRRADLRRHRRGPRRRPQAPARDPGHRGVVRQHGDAHRLHPRGVRTADRGGAPEPGAPLRRRRRPCRDHPDQRHGLRHAERPVLQPEDVPGTLPAVPAAGERLDPHAHAVEDLHALLRRHRAAARAHRRGRVRHPEPGAVLGPRDGPRGTEAAVRQPPGLLGRRREHAGDAPVRHRRRRCGTRCAGGSRRSRPAAASCSARSTTSRR